MKLPRLLHVSPPTEVNVFEASRRGGRPIMQGDAHLRLRGGVECAERWQCPIRQRRAPTGRVIHEALRQPPACAFGVKW